MTNALLPVESSKWELAIGGAMMVQPEVAATIDAMRGVKYSAPRAAFLPFLVWEYGLGELTPYVPNLYDLIDQGVRWQRVRGTVSAIAIGLAWIGYAATVEEAWTGRRWWNSFQLRFAALPANDLPDLERVEGITGLSVPKRSQLRRGVHEYDVGAVELDEAMLDGGLLEDESGIAITQAGTVWSFGRLHESEYTLTATDGAAIGNWIDPVVDTGLLWADLNSPWADSDFLWAEDSVLQRQAVLAGWFADKVLFLRLSGAGDEVIGYRRCRAVWPVHPQFGGAYSHGGQVYEPAPAGGALYVEALTQFGDADGVECTNIALMIGAAPAAGVKPGRLWLAPDELTGGVAIAGAPADIPLRRTVREQFKILVRF